MGLVGPTRGQQERGAEEVSSTSRLIGSPSASRDSRAFLVRRAELPLRLEAALKEPPYSTHGAVEVRAGAQRARLGPPRSRHGPVVRVRAVRRCYAGPRPGAGCYRQAPAALTADDYARAERFLAAAVNPLVVGTVTNATWLPDDRFTYRRTTADGVEFMLVDPAKKTAGRPSTTTAWPRRSPRHPAPRWTRRSCPSRRSSSRPMALRWRSTSAPSATRATWRAPPARPFGVKDRQRGGVARRHARRVHQGLEPVGARPRLEGGAAAHHRRRAELRLRHRQRRLDGRATAPIVLWSPDSKKVATFQQDERNVGDMYLVGDQGRAPGAQGLEVSAARRRGSGDAAPRRHRHRAPARSCASRRAPDYHRAMLGDDVR